MAITDVRATGVESSGRSIDQDGKITFTLTVQYEAVSDSASDTTVDAESSIFLPAIGSQHPSNAFLTVRERNANRESPLYYLVDVLYSTEATDPENDDPIDTSAKLSFSTVQEEVGIDEDVNGDPLATVLGEPYQGLTRVISDLQVTIEKPFLVFDPASFYLFNDRVNSDTFLGFPPGTARVVDIGADQVKNANVPHWMIRVVVQFRKPYRTTDERAWWKRVRHEGYYENGGGGGDDPRVRATDANREPTSQPVLLDRNGYKINFTNGVPDEDPYWLEFQVYEETSFSGMNLGV